MGTKGEAQTKCPILQLIHNAYQVNNPLVINHPQANMIAATGYFIYAHLKI